MTVFHPLRTLGRCVSIERMNAKPSDWIRLILSLLGYAAAAFALALLMNRTGDCGYEVQDCGETARRLSFVVLALGVAWLSYLVVRFVHDHRA